LIKLISSINFDDFPNCFDYTFLNPFKNAVENYEEMILSFGETGELSNKASSLRNIGKIFEKFDEHHEAIKVYEEVFQINTKLGDKMGNASDLYNLGRVYETCESCVKL
jgi:tetratricopeptide (TPR) repeat protein